ncbi:HutD family protein [Rhodanobacter sp. AS-Z3]|uniref:HutD/Ves family protein n=1 Tax=Rhodanobacter sp. AS-Z3 TaxID=3031330 RepID=UPI002478F6BF|nr:HutD family protein [Rhodanobacter sp. AS-Z3]WEN15931.1 HutD family protein [Rhodanobacter sp. AS-Z3]
MIIRLQDCPPKAWKNGLGRTRELAIHPPAAGSEDFEWRVSIAEVDSAAPFSTFPGIDRLIALIDGDGFNMTLDDEATHALTQPLVPFSFPGEATVAVSLFGGPTRDFNLMLRRNRVAGDVLAWHGPAVHQIFAPIALVFCVQGRIDTIDGPLQAGEAWLPSSHDSAATLHDGALALAVQVEPRGASAAAAPVYSAAAS